MTGNDDSPDTVRPFAGLTRHSDMTLDAIPEVGGHGSSMRWWTADYLGLSDEEAREDDIELPGEGFATALTKLPRASSVTAGWKHPVTGEWVETTKHNALVDPEKTEGMAGSFGSQAEINSHVDNLDIGELVDLAERLGIDGDEPPTRDEVKEALIPGDNALYHIPTDDYEVINPGQSLRPLAEVLREEDFGDSVFGEFRLTRGGGRVSGDIFVDGMNVQHPDIEDDDKPIVVGLEVGYDFFGDTAFRARGVALRTSCMNAMRAITDWEVIKHAGDVDNRVDWRAWWTDLLEEIDLKRDQLSQIIAEASEMEFDLTDLPEDFAMDHDSLLEAFYDYAGLPGYLAQEAANACRAEAADPFRPTWWDLHNGATYAITHTARGEVMGGGSIDGYNRLADDMLMNPPAFEERVQNAYETDREHREDATLSEEGGGIAEIQAAFESVRDKKESYEERQDQMKQLVAAETGDTGGAAD